MDPAVAYAYPTAVMGVLGLAFGALLAFASIKFYVQKDERIEKIRAALPGANCGSCGYPGCDGYADGVVNEGAPVNKCTPGGNPVAQKIGEVMGVAAGAMVPMVAHVKCAGTPENSPKTVKYEGVADCRSAVIVPGTTPNACPFGCIGLGTCTKVCSYDAIKIVNGVAKVDKSKCGGCGACAAICPKSVISIVPKSSPVMVNCGNNWRGAAVKNVCAVGCRGCNLCVKNCPSEAITMVKNVAVIDGTKCTNCGTCIEKCPAKSITNVA